MIRHLILLPALLLAPLSTPAALAQTGPATAQFPAETAAKAHCPADSVVWVNKESKVIHAAGTQHYGKTKSGTYMCRKDADNAGFHPPRTRTTASKPAVPATNAPTNR